MDVHMNKTYKLDTFQLSEVQTLAKAAADKWKGNHKSPYGTNSIKIHEIGKLGEIGLYSNLVQSYPDLEIVPTFKLDDLEADIIIKSNNPDVKDLRIEVKSSKNVVWNQLHATVNARQVHNIKKKSDIVVYCSVHTVKGIIHIEGFNYTDDAHEDFVNCEVMVQTTKRGNTVMSFVLNERPLDELIQLIETRRKV